MKSVLLCLPFAFCLGLTLGCKTQPKKGEKAHLAPESQVGPIMEGGDDNATLPLSPTVEVNSFDCDKLDYGLYWFGPGDKAQKAEKGKRSSFYDPTKPTFLYIHGWQASNHKLKRRASFNYKKTDPILGIDTAAADAWINAGWNVAAFYWNQFADEQLTRAAEDKIWNDKPLTWKKCDGTDTNEGAPSGNIADALYNDFVQAMGNYQGPNIRIAGHSLGNQLATRLTEKLSTAIKAGKLSPKMLPKRVALLDPWWMTGNALFEARGPIVKTTIESLIKEGVIFERYKTSDLADDKVGDRNLELTKIIGQTEILPDYYSENNQGSRHMAAPFLYFLSFASPPPKGCIKPCTDVAPSAATSDERIAELMKEAAEYTQVGGKTTPETDDNTFLKKIIK